MSRAPLIAVATSILAAGFGFLACVISDHASTGGKVVVPAHPARSTHLSSSDPSSFGPPRSQPTASEPGSTEHREDWIDFVASISADGITRHGEIQERRVALSRMPQWIARFHLDDAQSRALEAVLMDRMSLSQDMSTIAEAYNDDALKGALQSFWVSELAPLDARIAEIIGPRNFDRFVDDLSRVDSRPYLVEFLGAAFDSGVPISPALEKSISELLIKYAAVGDWHARMTAIPDLDTGLNSYDQQALALLATQLSPEQLELFKKVKAESHAYDFAVSVPLEY